MIAEARSSNTSLADSTLLARISRRDEQALGLLYDRYGTLVYTIALHITQDRALAEEVVQGVFQTAWQFASGCQINVSVSAWLINITRQRAIDATQLHDYRVPECAELLNAANVIDTSEQLDQRTDRRAVRAALQVLPSEQRKAIELAYYSGLTCDEIAAQLGKPRKTINTHVREGLIALRSWFYSGTEIPIPFK